MCEPPFTQNLPSLIDNLVQSISTSTYIDWANDQPDYASGLYAIIDY